MLTFILAAQMLADIPMPSKECAAVYSSSLTDIHTAALAQKDKRSSLKISAYGDAVEVVLQDIVTHPDKSGPYCTSPRIADLTQHVNEYHRIGLVMTPEEREARDTAARLKALDDTSR